MSINILVIEDEFQVLGGPRVIEGTLRVPSATKPPYIFISARSTKKDVRKGILFGAKDYITKPFTASELLFSVKNQLKKFNKIN